MKDTLKSKSEDLIMYYSAYDLQCNCYFESGRNSETEAECIDDICSFLIDGEDIPDTTPAKDILSIFEVEIHEHEQKMPSSDCVIFNDSDIDRSRTQHNN